MLLIDELDRADEEFEGFLLELLGDFQLRSPSSARFSTIPPIVVIRRTEHAELHDALKRRCLYFWIEYRAREELRSVKPSARCSARLAEQVTASFRS